MLDLNAITVPTLLLDKPRARHNIRTMAAKARRLGIRFRPHFKTHQSAAMGEWFRAEGVRAITVSSLRMAEYFARAGWDDITIAFPVNVREIAAMARLAERVELGLLVDSERTLDAVNAGIGAPVRIWLEADAGYQRSGVDLADTEKLVLLAQRVASVPGYTLAGLLTHAGNSYGVQGRPALEQLHRQTVARLVGARDALERASLSGLEISIGDTPCCSVLDDLGPVDEMRPGNFVFYDWMQHQIGVCREDEIAVAVACPVVATYPARREVVVYGGAVHLSKEMLRRSDGSADYGRVAPLTAAGWGETLPGVWLRSLSQEHGIIAAEGTAYAEQLADLAVGDLVAIVPIHSCLTADLLKRYTTLDGATIEMLRPW